MQAAEGYVGISTLKNCKQLSARRIPTPAEKSHPLNSVAPPATILNDVPTFSVGRAFLDLHCVPAYDAVHQIDQGTFIVVQRMSSRFVGLQGKLSRPLQLSERFMRAKLSRSMTSEPGRYVPPAVLHF